MKPLPPSDVFVSEELIVMDMAECVDERFLLAVSFSMKKAKAMMKMLAGAEDVKPLNPKRFRDGC